MATESRIAVELARESEFSLGNLRIRPASREVLSADQTEVLEPRVMQVLVSLARRRGEVVSRDDLIEECWGGRVVGEDAVTRCVARVRRLAEVHGSFAVETIARVGYRLLEKAPPADTAASPPPQVPPEPPARLRRARKPLLLAAGALVLIAALVFAGMQWRDDVARREMHARVIGQVADLVQKDQYGAAFRLGWPLLREDPALRKDPVFAESWRQIVMPMRPLVTEAGATVDFKPYDDVDGEWLPVGITPLVHTVDAPRGPLRIRVTKPGFRPALFVVANPGPSVANDVPNQAMVNRGWPAVPLPLAAEGSLPDDMVLVPRTHVPVNLGGWTPDRGGNFALDVPAFGIGRHEVTNAQFKQFIDAGGYDNPVFWQGLQFEEQGRVLTWPEARKRFVDATSRPGPAGWQLSTYPSGQADFPVGGISWYEAVAYARFRGEELPTIHHWMRAAFAPYDIAFNVTPAVAVSSRFYAQAPTSALDPIGLGAWGTYHTNGNVREWVWNFAGKNAVALGGAWPDYALDNSGAYTVPPMSRLPTHGMRLMHSLAGSTTPAAWREPIQLYYEKSTPYREPVSDDAFAVMRAQFSTAHPKPQNVTVTQVRETPLWIAERVLLEFEEQESVPLYIVRPKVRAGRMQPVVYGPPQNCCVIKRANDNVLEQLVVSEFVVNSGRMLVMPIWWGSYERWISETLSPAALQDLQREQVLAWHRDLSATIDYLQSRDDVDSGHVGYLGFSRGASHYATALALEPRIEAVVLISGGIATRTDINPMVDLTHYAPRIHFPVLMINGKFDHIAPYERSQRRLFDLLGTPASQKKHIVYDGGHFQYPLNSVAHDSTDWFDQYLGAAR